MKEKISYPFLSIATKKALDNYIIECRKLGVVDVDLVRDIAITTIKYLNGSKAKRKPLEIGQELENRWYESLRKNKPDWKVYDTDYYLGELWACWIVYSRHYLKCLLPSKGSGIIESLSGIKTVADLGCGIGYTTAGLKELFPDASIVGTNLPGTVQTRFAERLGEEYQFKIVSDIEEINTSVDLIFASEYFEHISLPVHHLRNVLAILKPKALLIANSFGTRAIGHFDYYNIEGKNIPSKQVSKIFNKELVRWGYQKVKTKFWNNRPNYWVRVKQK